MLNKVILIGNLGKDPEIRTLDSGVSRAIFTLATNESYKDKNGEYQQTTEWHTVVLWRSMAERAKYLRKGMLVYVEGKLNHRKWVDKDGKDHYNTDIAAETIKILEKETTTPIQEIMVVNMQHHKAKLPMAHSPLM